MDKVLIVNLSLFTMNHDITLVDGDNIQVISSPSFKELGKALNDACIATNTNYIHIHGNKKMAKKIIKDFDKNSNNKFSKNEVKIEVE